MRKKYHIMGFCLAIRNVIKTHCAKMLKFQPSKKLQFLLADEMSRETSVKHSKYTKMGSFLTEIRVSVHFYRKWKRTSSR